MTDLTQISASDLLALYRSKAVSPVQATQAVLNRIAAMQPQFNAYRLVDEEGALAQARASEARWHRGTPQGALDGIPVAFKDLLNVKAWPTRKGSLATSPDAQTHDAPVAARLRESGAVLLGKTQTAELGWRGLTESRLAGVTPNAWNTAYASGGSSGGAAVAAALGLGPLHVGTDGGGSIRQPAAVNGVFGFKPSYGRVPGYPPAHNGNLFHIGPITRTVTDAALLLNTIAAPDVRDWTALPQDGRDWTADLQGGVKGLRIAFSARFAYATVDPGVAALVQHAVAQFEALGAVVDEVDPGFEDPAPILDVLAAERAIRVQRDFGDAGVALLDPGIQQAIQRALRFGLSDVLQAQEQRAALAMLMGRFHQRYDLLLSPVLSAPVPRLGIAPESPFCAVFNLTQQPAASVPIGLDSNGLPVGLQIVGPAHGDAVVLRAAKAFEQLRPFATPVASHSPSYSLS
ncbi:MAG: amidase [Pseudomonadota bacterium]